jgi:hypothetical protein
MLKRRYVTIFIALLTVLVGYSMHVIAQEEPYAPIVDPTQFVEVINHPYFSLTPGTTFVYEGESEGGAEHVEVSVLPETKQILGVICTVVRDTVWVDGEVVEDTIDWFAQDEHGNVWYMGEAVKDYENGVVVSTAGSWEAGVDGAQPGIIMEADPQIGDIYRQEYYADEAEDMAEVLDLTESTSIPFGAFDNLLVTKEWTPLEPDVAENKYYAPGVGLVLGVTVEGGTGRVELVDMITWDADVENEDADEADDESEAAPGVTPIISAIAALQAAEAHMGGTAREVELEFDSGRWVYQVEIGSDEVTLDAIVGEILSVEAEDD